MPGRKGMMDILLTTKTKIISFQSVNCTAELLSYYWFHLRKMKRNVWLSQKPVNKVEAQHWIGLLKISLCVARTNDSCMLYFNVSEEETHWPQIQVCTTRNVYAEQHKAKLLATVTTVKYKFYSGAPCLVRPEASPSAQGLFLVTVVPTLVTEAQELSVHS